MDGRHFLAEHFWFDGSAVQFDFNLISRLLKCLLPQQIQKFHKVAAPTGYESKLNWLRMLLEMVSEERAKIQREDAVYATMDDVNEEEEREEDDHDVEDGTDPSVEPKVTFCRWFLFLLITLSFLQLHALRRNASFII